MSIEERVQELLLWAGPLEIPSQLVHQRIEELMGRSVWTHEMADFEQLTAELRSGQPASITDVVGKIPAEKLVVVSLVKEDD